nr:protein tyrosine phosphatase [Paenibacillus prosopidis]
MKLLFICSRNKWRSLTAETIFQGVGGHEVRSAGTEEYARIKVNEGHVGWADLIFAMEKKHVRRLQDRFSHALINKKVICLHIPDDYGYMDEDLIGLLQSGVSEYIEVSEYDTGRKRVSKNGAAL